MTTFHSIFKKDCKKFIKICYTFGNQTINICNNKNENLLTTAFFNKYSENGFLLLRFPKKENFLAKLSVYKNFIILFVKAVMFLPPKLAKYKV